MFSLQSLIRRLYLYLEEHNKNTLTIEGTQAVFGLLRDQEQVKKAEMQHLKNRGVSLAIIRKWVTGIEGVKIQCINYKQNELLETIQEDTKDKGYIGKSNRASQNGIGHPENSVIQLSHLLSACCVSRTVVSTGIQQ